VGYEDFEVVKVTLTVVAPWPREDFFDIGVSSLLAHCESLKNLVAMFAYQFPSCSYLQSIDRPQSCTALVVQQLPLLFRYARLALTRLDLCSRVPWIIVSDEILS